MRRLVLAGVTALFAVAGFTCAASAAPDGMAREHASGAVLTPTAWRGGFYGPRFRGGLFIGPSIGFGVYAPYWYPPPAYYAPPVVVQQGYAAPPGYSPQAPDAYPPQASDGGGSWYYCNNPQGYYPYVRECMGQWQTVPANPDNAPR